MVFPFCADVTTLDGASASVAINDTQQFLQELQLLASPLANASDYLQVGCTATILNIESHSASKKLMHLQMGFMLLCRDKSSNSYFLGPANSARSIGFLLVCCIYPWLNLRKIAIDCECDCNAGIEIWPKRI